MKYVDCKTQAELNAALKDPNAIPNLVGGGYFEISDSSQVTASGSSQVRASGSSQVTASKYVTVTVSSKYVKVMGGVRIDFQPPQNLDEWFDEYSIEPKDGVVVLYKAVGRDFMSQLGGNYAPGETPESDKWDNGKEECGSGLHFCGTPHHALGFYLNAKRFVACPVAVDSIAMHVGGEYPQKVKAPRVVSPGCWEVDINGKRIEAAA